MDLVEQQSHVDDSCPPDRINEQSFKDSFLILKSKIFKANDIVIQYKTQKEDCDRLKAELNNSKRVMKELSNKYDALVAKEMEHGTQKQELDNKIKAHSDKIEELNKIIAGHKKQQSQMNSHSSKIELGLSSQVVSLNASNRELMDKHNELLENYNELLRKSPERVPCKECSTDTDDLDTKLIAQVRVDVADRSTCTEGLKVEDDCYPIFCDSCEARFQAPPIEKIFRVMKECPPLITQVESPCKSRYTKEITIETSGTASHVLETEEFAFEGITPIEEIPVDPPPPSETLGSDLTSEIRDMRRKIESLEVQLKKSKIKPKGIRRQSNSNLMMPQVEFIAEVCKKVFDMQNNESRRLSSSRRSDQHLSKVKKSYRNNVSFKNKRSKIASTVTPWTVQSMLDNDIVAVTKEVKLKKKKKKRIEKSKNVELESVQGSVEEEVFYDTIELDNFEDQNSNGSNVEQIENNYESSAEDHDRDNGQNTMADDSDVQVTIKSRGLKSIRGKGAMKPSTGQRLMKKMRNLRKTTRTVLPKFDVSKSIEEDSASQEQGGADKLSNEEVVENYSPPKKQKRVAHAPRENLPTSSVNSEVDKATRVQTNEETEASTSSKVNGNTFVPTSEAVAKSSKSTVRRSLVKRKRDSKFDFQSENETVTEPEDNVTPKSPDQSTLNENLPVLVKRKLITKDSTESNDMDGTLITDSSISGTELLASPDAFLNFTIDKNFDKDEGDKSTDTFVTALTSTSDMGNQETNNEASAKTLELPAAEEVSASIDSQETASIASSRNEELSEINGAADEESTTGRALRSRRSKKIVAEPAFKRELRSRHSEPMELPIAKRTRRMSEKSETKKEDASPEPAKSKSNVKSKREEAVETVEGTRVVASPRQLVEEHLSDCKTRKKPTKRQDSMAKTILMHDLEVAQGEIEKLVNHETWDDAIHFEVINNMKSLSSVSIAKAIIDCLKTYPIEKGETVDNSFTPPAPPMTPTHRKLLTLMLGLEPHQPTIFKLVFAGIEHSLFQLNQESVEYEIVELLSRMYIVMGYVKKDREKVRIFICDALYCLKFKAICIIYIALTCWSQLFSSCGANEDKLLKTVIHVIMILSATKNYRGLVAVKKLLRSCYGYPSDGYDSKALANELLGLLKDGHTTSVDAALLVLAKREGTQWTNKTIVETGLLPLIISNSASSQYNSLQLLGNILRVFPMEDKNNEVSNIMQQLCDILDSGQGSVETEEGTAAALISLTRHDLNKSARSIVKWTPKQPPREEVVRKLEFLIKKHSPAWWTKLLKQAQK